MLDATQHELDRSKYELRASAEWYAASNVFLILHRKHVAIINSSKPWCMCELQSSCLVWDASCCVRTGTRSDGCFIKPSCGGYVMFCLHSAQIDRMRAGHADECSCTATSRQHILGSVFWQCMYSYQALYHLMQL